MDKFCVITSSDNETIKLGEKISKNIKPNIIIGLIGNLASGKTTFVKGVFLFAAILYLTCTAVRYYNNLLIILMVKNVIESGKKW